MKIKLTPILLLLIGEAVITTILFFMKTQYIDMCEPYTFLNPFGWHPTKELCLNVINNVPHQNFYLMFDIFILTIVGYLIFRLIKYFMRKYSSSFKLSPIFIVIFIESLITFIFGSTKLPCGSPCDPHSFLNPFGITSQTGMNCIAACAKNAPIPFFYLAFDITVVTIVIYLGYKLIKGIRSRKQKNI